jgi:hypothetical protein
MSHLIDVLLQTRSLRGSCGLTVADFGSAGFGKFCRTGTRVGGDGLVSLDSVTVVSFLGCQLAGKLGGVHRRQHKELLCASSSTAVEG